MKLLEILGWSSKSRDEEDKKQIEQMAYDSEREQRDLAINSRLYDLKEEKFPNRYEYYINLIILMVSEMMDRIDTFKYIDRDMVLHLPEHYDDHITKMVKDKYYEVIKYIDSHYHQPFRAIYEFAKFLIVADALLLYSNDDTENVRSIPESSDSIKLEIITDDFNIGYYFTKDLTKSQMKSLLEEYVDGNDSKNAMIGYVEVKRNGGSKTKSNFTFDMDNGIHLDSSRDQILFDTIVNNTIEMIIETYNRILDRVIPVYTGENIENFKFMEYLDGFRVRDITTE